MYPTPWQTPGPCVHHAQPHHKKTTPLPLSTPRVLRFTSQRRQRVPPFTAQRVATPPATQNCHTKAMPPPFPVFPTGKIIQKRFADRQFHEGEVISFDSINQYYKIKHREGGSEEFDQQQLRHHHKRTQKYSAPTNKLKPPITPAFSGIPILKQPKPNRPPPTNLRQRWNTTASPFTRGYKPAATALFLHHFVGAVGTIWDEKLNKMAAYQDLVKHPDPVVRHRWLTSGENEFGCLFQGYGTTEGTDVLD